MRTRWDYDPLFAGALQRLWRSPYFRLAVVAVDILLLLALANGLD